MMDGICLSVFTKPWPGLSLDELGVLVSTLGFDGVELPVRPGYQVEPQRVAGLAQAVETLGRHGVQILSVAGPADEATIAACAEAGVPTIRVMAPVARGESYPEAEARYRREYDALLPLLERYGVQLGVQNHYGRFVANAVGLQRLVAPYDPRSIGLVWDAAHEALDGNDLDLALDVAWPHLAMVNLKNAYWRRVNGPEAEVAAWEVYWTTGRHGQASWPTVVRELRARGYRGVICLPAEYSDEPAVERLIAEDVAWVRALFAGEEG